MIAIGIVVCVPVCVTCSVGVFTGLCFVSGFVCVLSQEPGSC